jgi:hypothetical protein
VNGERIGEGFRGWDEPEDASDVFDDEESVNEEYEGF